MVVQIKSDGSLIEFLANLRQESNDGDGYVTTREICEALGISHKKAADMLRTMINSGIAEHGHVNIRSIDGRIVRSNGYRLKKADAS